MGEKGNGAEAVVAAAAPADPSIVERVTTTTTQTVVGAGEDLVAKLKESAVDHGAAAIIAEAQGRLGRGGTAQDASGARPPQEEPGPATEATTTESDPGGDAGDDPAAR